MDGWMEHTPCSSLDSIQKSQAGSVVVTYVFVQLRLPKDTGKTPVYVCSVYVCSVYVCVCARVCVCVCVCVCASLFNRENPVKSPCGSLPDSILI